MSQRRNTSLTNPEDSLAHCGNPRRSALNSCCTTAQSGSNIGSFCNEATLADGSVVAWGDPNYGGDSSAVQDQLKNVQQIQATGGGAFAAILEDGSVVAWGHKAYGGDSSCSSRSAQECATNPGHRRGICCHLSRWIRGYLQVTGHTGGDSSAVQDQLKNVQQIPGYRLGICCHLSRWIRGFLG